MRRCWLFIGLVAGCGRFGFADRTSDARSDIGLTDGAICHTGAWSAPQLVPGLATGAEENGPWISADETTIYFESNRVGGQARAVWMATRASKTDSFGTPTVVPNVDSAMDEGDPELTADGLTLYFLSRISGSDAVYVATRPTLGDAFTIQGPMTIAGSTAPSSGPALSGDELTFYYTKDLLQIAFATRPDRSSGFTFVRELSEVNAPQTDGDASITADGLELFFDSYRSAPGAVFVATRTSTTDMFSAPVEVTGLVASGHYAGTPQISSDGRTLYYAANPTTQVDLYFATRDCP